MREPAPPIPTLEDLPRHGVTHINVWCGRWPYPCDHSGRIAVADINLKQTILELGAKLVCQVCGTKGGSAMPSWPGGGGTGSAHSLSSTAAGNDKESTP